MANGFGGAPVSPFPKQPPRPVVEPFEAFSPGEWQDVPAPAYDWMVEGCFLKGTVAMVSGDGGIGKSLLMQQLLTAASIGKNWLGLETKQVKGFGFFCEDDKDELHRRQERINAHYDCEHADVDAIYVSRVGMENILAEFDRRTDRIIPTPLWDQTEQAILDFGASIIVIDTIADTFGGLEFARVQVRRFVTQLRRLAVRTQGVVIITAHPSVAGMNTGTGLSGSTAWNNSVRSRLYLTKQKDQSENEWSEPGDVDNNRRILRTMKNNQGPGAGKIELIWKDGVFVIDEVKPSTGIVGRIAIDNAVIDAMTRMVNNGTRISTDNFSRLSIANLARSIPELRIFSRSEIENSTARLLAGKRVVVIELGPPSRRIKFIRPANTRYAGETESAA
jgi:RecA-family ATPase